MPELAHHPARTDGDSTPEVQVHSGLDGIVAARTRLSRVDGAAGRLILAGYSVEELAPAASFEEVTYLLWHDRLPTRAELATFRAALAARRTLPAATLELLQAAAKAGIDPMDALRTAAATLSLTCGSLPLSAQAEALVAALPTAAAAYYRLGQGLAPIAPDPGLPHAANFLYMLSGEVPSAERARGVETYLNTVSDHGLNASTFTARVILSTGSDLVSAVTGAIGALKGPLHGGAPGPALELLLEVAASGNAEAVIRGRLQRGERLMGFGHRIYRVRDPRAEVLGAAAERLLTSASGDPALLALARQVETTALALLREHKPDRRLDTNVEFYTALLLHSLGLPAEHFSTTFALGRVAGWTAHGLEQVEHNRLIRPQALYTGAEGRRWQPLAER